MLGKVLLTKDNHRFFLSKYIIFIVFSICLVYANSLFNGFVYDDVSVIVQNNFIKSPQNLRMLFTQRYLTKPIEVSFYLGPYNNIGTGETSYRPVATLSYFLNYALFKLNPLGWHATNLLLHTLCAIAIFYLVNHLFGMPDVSFLTSLVFGIHPINVEVINCSSFRPNILAFLFSLLSIILYFKYTYTSKTHKHIWYLLGSLFMFMLAVFSKEIVIIMPLALVVCDYFKNALSFNALRRNIKIYCLYFLSSIFHLYVYFFIFPPTQNVFEPVKLTFEGILRMFDIFGFYFKDMIYPNNLTSIAMDHFDYSRLMGLLAIIITIVCLYIIFKKRKAFTIISFAIIWFFIWLLPMNNFIFPFRIPAAYRYLYISMLGFSLVLSVILLKLWNWNFRFLAKNLILRHTLVIGSLIYFAIYTISANKLWENNLILHMSLAEKYPKSLSARAGLGFALLNYGNFEEAQREYESVVSSSGSKNNQYDLATSYFNLGIIYREKGTYEKSEEMFMQAGKIFPQIAWRIYAELGFLRIKQALFEEALSYFKLSKEENPLNSSAYVGSGISYALLGYDEQAREEWLKALEMAPNSWVIRHNLETLEGKNIRP